MDVIIIDKGGKFINNCRTIFGIFMSSVPAKFSTRPRTPLYGVVSLFKLYQGIFVDY